MLLSLERVVKLILDMISRVAWNKARASLEIVPWPVGRAGGTKSLTSGREAYSQPSIEETEESELVDVAIAMLDSLEDGV
jgi:hypothetical protein